MLCFTEEFACHDGDTIIPADKKCDGENDCPQRPWSRRSKTEDEEPHMCKGPGMLNEIQ